MYKRILILLTIVQMLSFTEGGDNNTEAKKVVCYYAGLLGKELKYLYPEDIDATVCTHIVYLHGGINRKLEEVSITPLFGDNPTGGAGHAEKLVKLKEANPNLKLHLFISPEDIDWVIQNAERRANIIASAVVFLNATGFDGLSFALYYTDAGMEKKSAFFCETNAEFEKYGYTVSAVASDELDLKSLDEEAENISRCCSFIYVPSKDYWDNRSNTTALHAPINQTKMAIEAYIEKGFSANKLLVSIPAVGTIFTLQDPKQTGVGASVEGPGNNGTEYTDGYMISYSQLSERLNDTTEGWTIIRDAESDSPYAYSKEGLWASYEDPISAAAKARYILENNLGGAAIFLIDMDSIDGVTGKKLPITTAVSETLKQSVRANSSP